MLGTVQLSGASVEQTGQGLKVVDSQGRKCGACPPADCFGCVNSRARLLYNADMRAKTAAAAQEWCDAIGQKCVHKFKIDFTP